jgi:hypothetical protein
MLAQLLPRLDRQLGLPLLSLLGSMIYAAPPATLTMKAPKSMFTQRLLPRIRARSL